jgi:hypothetical protein
MAKRRLHPKLKEILLGDRVRPPFQARVRGIAGCACYKHESFVHGSMWSSSQTDVWNFLDGGLRETRGYFQPTSGMFIDGDLARQYILYELGENASELLATGAERRSDLQRRVKTERDHGKTDVR